MSLMFLFLPSKSEPLSSYQTSDYVNFDNGKVSGSISLQGLVIDKLKIGSHEILNNKNKIIPTWNNIDKNTKWTLVSEDINRMEFQYDDNRMIFKYDNEGNITIDQIGEGKKNIIIVTSKNDMRLITLKDSSYENIYNGWNKVENLNFDKSYTLINISSNDNFDVFIKEQKLKKGYFSSEDFIHATIENNNLKFNIGDKDLSRLEKLGLYNTINFGWLLWWITKPSFYFINKLLNSFSFVTSMIIFTILTRFLALPFTIQMNRYKAKMTRIKPELDQIKSQYTDSTIMNQEITKLFQREKINPLGSVIGVIINIPIMLSIYNVYPLIYAGWNAKFLWIDNLALPNLTMFIIFFASVVISFLLHMEKQQLYYLLFISAIFILFVYHQPSGLLLSFTVANIFTLVQNFLLRLKS